jgi:hypothetical protein
MAFISNRMLKNPSGVLRQESVKEVSPDRGCEKAVRMRNTL